MLHQRIEKLKAKIGNTPIYELSHRSNRVFAKMEAHNPWGSVKDRSTFNIIYEAIREGKITENTTIIESCSGNFALSLAGICNFLGLKFIGVIDPNINPMNEKMLKLMSYDTIKVQERDDTGGFLKTRIQQVRDFCRQNEHAFCPNQYENGENPNAYTKGLFKEIEPFLDQVQHVFIPVSSGGILKGLSGSIKKQHPEIRINAVDVDGSVIFSDNPKSGNFQASAQA